MKKSSKFIQKKQVKQDNSLRPLIKLNQELNQALIAKYGPNLLVGESFSITVERQKEFVSAKILVEGAAASTRLVLEAVRLVDDQEEIDGSNHICGENQEDDWLDLVIDYVDYALEQYFENDRFIKCNDDWRYDYYYGHTLRYRFSFSRPNLEAIADELLKKGGAMPDGTLTSEDNDKEV